MASSALRMPVIALPHGGGPCFQLPDGTIGPRGMWAPMRRYLEKLSATLPAPPKALLIISAHWEADVASVMTSPAPPMLYDYYGFPPEAYSLKWPAPGAPQLAQRVRSLLSAAGILSAEDASRGFDHGAFVPLMVAYPDAALPATQLSLLASLDAAAHVALGAALAPLRDEGVLIIASCMTYHNMGGLMKSMSGGEDAGAVRAQSDAFDAWLRDAVAGRDVAPEERRRRLTKWASEAPHGRACHPREEHLLPLLVAAGAAGLAPADVAFSDALAGAARVSAFEWRDVAAPEQCAA